MQNASLSVLTQTQMWSLGSHDSLWGDGEDDTVGPLDQDPSVVQPPETWLMLEFCDRGSLLVNIPLALPCFPAGNSPSCLLVTAPPACW